MDQMNYPANFWRGISNKDWVANGHVLADAFQFDKPVRDDGFREMSINWNDCEDALTLALNQRKDNGKLQFRGGVAQLDLAFVKLVMTSYLELQQFSYERREVDGNPYHGNLLISHKLDKRIRSIISNGLALAAGTNIVYQPDGAE